MTKEEILENTTQCTINEDADLDNPENFYFKYADVLKAMEQYAKEEAIEFVKFLNTEKKYYTQNMQRYLITELYNQFKRDNNQT
jgi:formylmethanofuran dehydrogenase subunit C